MQLRNDTTSSNTLTRKHKDLGRSMLSSSTLASEKDPRQRHRIRSSLSRRSFPVGSCGSRTGFSSALSSSVQLPPTEVLEDIDLEEGQTEADSPMYGECDKFGNKILSAGGHSRRSSRSTARTLESSASR